MADLVFWIGDGNANADADRDNGFVERNRGVAGIQDFFGNILCIAGRANVIETYDKFISAHADQCVVVAETFPHAFADFDQGLIADCVPVGVVDLTEVVKINEKESVDLFKVF